MFDYIDKYMTENKKETQQKKRATIAFLWDGDEIAYIGLGHRVGAIISNHKAKGLKYTHYSIMDVEDLELPAYDILMHLIFKHQPKNNTSLSHTNFRTPTGVRNIIKEQYPEYKNDKRFYVPKLKKAIRGLGVELQTLNGNSYYDMDSFDIDTVVDMCLGSN